MSKYLLLLGMLVFGSPAQAYWNCLWPFQTRFDVKENSATTQNNYQIKFTLTAASLYSAYNWTATGFDLRVLDSDDNTPLEFWIESWNQSAKTATIWVRFPTLTASATRSIYFYYGNNNAPTLANVPLTFVEPGIKFHTRNSTADPTNKTTAFNAFNSATDGKTGYGCKFITDFTNINNQSSFPAGKNSDFAAYSESYFEVKSGEAGTWRIRYGADFGRGGALYVDDVALEEDWNADLWWNNSWSNADRLEGSINLSVGYHKLEVLGFEGCCDGGITVQFRKPGGNWTTFSTSNIDIRSRHCPIAEPTVSNMGHTICQIDLALTVSVPAVIARNTDKNLIFTVTNNGPKPSIPNTVITLTLASGIEVQSVSGTHWSCSGTTGTFTCTYTQVIIAGSAAPNLILAVRANSSASNPSTYSAAVASQQYEPVTNNNTVSGSVAVLDLVLAETPSCTPQSGLFARFFNTLTSSTNYANNAADFQTMVNNFANMNYLYGQTLFNNINGTGNPFNSGSDHYLTLLQGYLYVPTDGTYQIGLDGDDAVEVRLHDSVVTAYYGPHGASASAVNPVSINLEAGYHLLEFRHQEYQGGDSYYLYWRKPGDTAATIIPASGFVNCAGNANIVLNSAVLVLDDPINGINNPKAIPGANVQYDITVNNTGNFSSNSGSLSLVQSITDTNKMFVGNLGVNGPVTFTDGSGLNASGLNYNFISLNSSSDGLEFSNNNGATFNYVPVPDANGFDDAITHFRITFTGSMKPALDGYTPTFSYRFKGQVK